MKDIVTFETAVRLKEAGFPQPVPEAGQWWYNPDFGPFLVGKLWMVDGRLRNIFYPDTGKVVNKQIRLFPDCVFAPTATDILRESPNYYYIRKYRYDTENRFSIFCELQEGDLTQIAKGVDINPAEAAAEAWLKLNDKK